MKSKKLCYICEKKFFDDKNKKGEYELYHKVKDHWKEIIQRKV